MKAAYQLSGRVVAAARTLAGISQNELASASGLTRERLRLLEAGGAALVPDRYSQALSRALEKFGVLAIPEGDGMGAGVRLKFTRQDVKQIIRLEGEGGITKLDDVP
jgi:transcriptional regulator with XRE-family HTH domain